MAEYADQRFMSRALELASKAGGSTLPNPMVGAVIVKNGKVIAEGYHKGPGNPHAEVTAIKKAGGAAKNSTLYINLEPCCHTGRTGPCTDSIIEAGITRVVYAATDPNPNVNGKGARTLRNAGIEVQNGLLSIEAKRLNDAYIGVVKTGRPYVTVKLAQSLDGKIATIGGDSKWISCNESRKLVHKLRAESQAVLVGMETVKRDNPSLTTRLVKGNNPYRIVVSNLGKISKQSKLVTENNDSKTIIATSLMPKGKSFSNLTYWTVKKNRSGNIELSDLLHKARDFGIHSILVEGGAEVVTSLLKARLVDKIVLVTAPIIIGDGVSAVGDLRIKNIKDAIKFKDYYRIKSGDDEIFVGYPDWKR